MSEIKLLPCPFCGGEAHITEYLGKKHIVYIECDECKVFMGNPRIIASSTKGKLYFESKTELIKAWNTRKSMDKIVEHLENASYWTDSTFDEDGYCNDDSNEVVDLYRAIDIIRKGGIE